MVGVQDRTNYDRKIKEGGMTVNNNNNCQITNHYHYTHHHHHYHNRVGNEGGGVAMNEMSNMTMNGHHDDQGGRYGHDYDYDRSQDEQRNQGQRGPIFRWAGR